MVINQHKPPIFRYAIISDTHIRPHGESSSPWKTNLMTNDRARWVAHAINNDNPSLVIHLGDVVHPVPHLSTHASAAKVAKEIVSSLSSPCYFVPGNHDVGDKDNPTVPSHIVNEDFIAYFYEHYGSTYQSFNHENIHFIIINSPVLNSGLPEEFEQWNWLENDLMDHKDERVHIFSHYPPYLYDPNEPSNYDNIDQPARRRLLDLIKKYSVEVFYAGHIHHFFHKKFSGIDIYNLLATGNLRQDYSNMFRVEALEEYGRNDVAKLGYCIVDVYENGFITHIRRSFGRTLQEGDTIQKEERVDEHFPNKYSSSPLGVQIRYPLAEVTDLPYMSPLDEFVRKKSRNDYTFLALWESGIRNIRIPLADLEDKKTRQRLEELHEMGMRYGFFTVNLPDPLLLRKYRDLVDFIEIVLPWEKILSTISDASRLREDLDLPVYIANIESSIHKKQIGPKFSHYMSHGFRPEELSKIEPILELKGAVDGFVFEVGQFDQPIKSVKYISEYSRAKGFKALINIRLAPEDPAEYLKDDLHNANRVIEAAIAAYAHPDVRVFIDTFMDHDRGYFPRIGLYDRRLNPRLAAFVLRNLNSTLNGYEYLITDLSRRESDDWTTISFRSQNNAYSLKLPKYINVSTHQTDSTSIDLTTGIITDKIRTGIQHLTVRRLK